MSSVEFLGGHEIFQVFVIAPDFDLVVSAFKIMAPLFEASHDDEHFFVVNVVVSFDVREAF